MTSTLLTIAVGAPSLGPSFFPPETLTRPPASAVEASGNALIARVLPTNQSPQAQTVLASQSFAPPQGTMDSYTAQYAPETYAVALSGSLTPAVAESSAIKEPVTAPTNLDPTYGGTSIPYLDHEIDKILAASQGNATITPQLPTFAAPGDPAPAPQTAAATQTQTTETPTPTPTPTPAPQTQTGAQPANLGPSTPVPSPPPTQ
ncbi:MAG TPA: hypothetical protein VN905_15340 [Candidatus Binatia bacterium]|nr:hypothetical protein [Candidatus Binatia bacterium]